MIYTHAAAVLLGLAVGFGSAWKVQAWRHDAAALAAIEQARETERMRRQATHAAAASHEADKVRIRTEFLPLTQEVERVVTKIEYRDRACLADDGVRLVNEAIRAANAGGVAGSPVPAASAAP